MRMIPLRDMETAVSAVIADLAEIDRLELPVLGSDPDPAEALRKSIAASGHVYEVVGDGGETLAVAGFVAFKASPDWATVWLTATSAFCRSPVALLRATRGFLRHAFGYSGMRACITADNHKTKRWLERCGWFHSGNINRREGKILVMEWRRQ